MYILHFSPDSASLIVRLVLEELGLPYEARPINRDAGELSSPQYRALHPLGKIPAMETPHGPMFESAAILMYLARKTKSPLLPVEGTHEYFKVMEWSFFQMASVGPMIGQMGHFVRFAKEKIPYAIDRYTNEVKRIFGVMDKQLGKNAFLAGANYSIADILTFCWTVTANRHYFHDLPDWPNVKRWHDGIMARPAVQKGLKVPFER